MKIQIIQLDEHDDIISARDKMAWCKTARILLVWPKEGKILTRHLDLVLLQRMSISLGSQLGLISRDRELNANADDLRIPVFTSVARAQRSYWKHNRTRPHPELALKSPRELRTTYVQTRQIVPHEIKAKFVRIGVFSSGLLAVLMLLAAFIPGAKVSITPNTSTQHIVFQVFASELIQASNLIGNLPLKKISIDVEGKDSLPTSGQVAVPITAAAGYVEFSNLTDQAVEIPEGTTVIGGMQIKVRFTTTRSGQMPAGLGKSAIIPVKALLPGEEGNLSARSIDAIDGSLGLSLGVTNTSAMSGGSSKPGSAVSEVDLITLENRLKKTLLQTATDHVMSLLHPQDQIVPKTLTQVSILDESHFPKVGQPGDVLTLSLHAEFSAYYLSGNDLQSLALTVLDANKPGGYLPINNAIKIKPIDEPSIDSNNAVQWKYQAERTLQAAIDTQKAVALIPGLSPKDATQHLVASLNLTKNPVINLFPGWWPRLPLLPLRIAITVTEGN